METLTGSFKVSSVMLPLSDFKSMFRSRSGVCKWIFPLSDSASIFPAAFSITILPLSDFSFMVFTFAPFKTILPLAAAIKEKQIHKIGLLGTRYTMEMDFYKSRLAAGGLEVLLPSEQERTEINRIIFEELCMGTVREASRNFFLEAMQSLAADGAEGIILGCTEIGLLVRKEHTGIPLFDTTTIHAKAAVDYALSN